MSVRREREREREWRSAYQALAVALQLKNNACRASLGCCRIRAAGACELVLRLVCTSLGWRKREEDASGLCRFSRCIWTPAPGSVGGTRARRPAGGTT